MHNSSLMRSKQCFLCWARNMTIHHKTFLTMHTYRIIKVLIQVKHNDLPSNHYHFEYQKGNIMRDKINTLNKHTGETKLHENYTMYRKDRRSECKTPIHYILIISSSLSVNWLRIINCVSAVWRLNFGIRKTAIRSNVCRSLTPR